MKNDKQIQKVSKYSVERISEKSNLLVRGLQQLGLLSKTLKLISGGEVVKIGALDGSRIFSFSDGDLFRCVFFDMKGLDTEGHAIKTNETEVLVYELVKEATPFEMFSSLNKDFEQLCLSQHQILEFLDKYKEYAGGKTNHFLFKSDGKIFIAQICVDSDDSKRLFGGVLENDSTAWKYPADGHFRVVVPKSN